MNSKQRTQLADIVASNKSPLSKVDELERFLEDSQVQKAVEIRTRGICDYCTNEMTHAGTNDGIVVIRACMAHLDEARRKLDVLREYRIKL